MLKMFHPNLFVLCLSLLAIDSAVCLGFAAEGDEVLKPHLWTALNRTALKPQGVRTGPNLRENKLRHNSALVAEDKHSSESESIQNGSGTKKEERVEQLMEESDREVLETQHTTCRITTEELVSTAQATVTRVMKGLCNSSKLLSDVSVIFAKGKTVSCDLYATPSDNFLFLFTLYAKRLRILEGNVKMEKKNHTMVK
jgi:hypothetical protein